MTGMLDHGLKIRTMVLPDVFLDHDSPQAQYDRAGLNARHVVAINQTFVRNYFKDEDPIGKTVKFNLFRELDRITRPDVVLASNTSSISITKIAG